MASRRLDISSLLCDDQVPEPVVLAPHLRHSAQSSTPSYTHHAPPPSMSPTLSPPSQMPHAHRPSSSHSHSSRHRLSPSSNPYPLPPPSISTPHQFSPPISAMATSKLPSFAATEERRRISGGSSTDPPVEQRHLAQPQQFVHQQPFRPHKLPDDHIRSPIEHRSPSLSPTIRSPIQPIRSSPPVPRHQPQIRLSPVDDLLYRPPQSRQQLEHEYRMQQQQHELQRQRHHHEQLLIQEQQQQQLARERQTVYTERSPLPPPPPHTHRGPSMPLQVEGPSLSPHQHRSPPIPSSHAGGRKSDPGQGHRVIAPVHADPIPPPSTRPLPEPAHVGEGSSHPNKKRRYSDSPEKERIRHLGYGRPEPMANAGASGHAELITPSPGERIHVSSSTLSAVENGREAHGLLSPPGRRSPPGSQSEEVEHTLLDVVSHAREEDAHEWFLEHFDDYNAPTVTQNSPPHAPSTPAVPAPSAPSGLPASGSPPPNKRTPTPSTMPEAAVALEQELEELCSPSEHVSKVEPDMNMEVDLAVTELVAETLNADGAKVEDMGMEVDVEDELLSLVDDRPTIRRPIMKSSTPGPSTTKLPAPVRASSTGVRHPSPSAVSAVSAPSPAGFLSPAVRPSSTRPTSERGSMPPPASVAPGRGKDKEEKNTDRAGSVAATAPMPGAKAKATSATATTAKGRTKPGPKPKPKTSDASLSATATKSKGAGSKKPAASRSRSTSVMPSGSAGPESNETKAEKQEEEEESDPEDDKLYCVCKTKYDEDRVMIACDRCDDWYHTQCVNMPDLEVDLVDQFICPPCIEKNPHLSLRTTYKPRCLYGLRHPDPCSTKACHRPARGAFSKYCSDECGVKYMQSRADAWAKKGGKTEKLWETVKDAEKREGVVICAEDQNGLNMEVDEVCKTEKEKALKQKRGKIEREVERLNGLLDNVVMLREEIKKGMDGVIWREKLLELATERAEQVGECGWDQRLCFGDEEWAEFGVGVLESYDDMKAEQGEGGTAEGEGEWWCPGKKMCDRHAGWQTVRYRDVCKEKEKKEDALSNLTTREREIRKRIEDILDPHGRNCNDSSGKSPLKASNAKLSNGHTKGKTNGDTTKKGKKRKAPS
ncbi:hypothetical protein FPV67DRAFT_1465728 [Lyophyllum atratum]|nr:hypothetical protein FPV67DRAFT_1465728 [Lyophyllum atratum]